MAENDVLSVLQETREALGVHVRGNVLIVDEAHNLVDAVNSAHSAQVSAAQLRAAQGQLSGYYQRFRTRLAAGARQYATTASILITTYSRPVI